MSKQYKYDAFISYRHTDLDKFVAEKIHKYLETFKLPKSIKNRNGIKKTKIERVFRDKEELTITNNLEDPIVQALRDSEYLVVICSPRTKESVWCRKEIETFIEFHGRNRILTVLIEGEPGESFPEELLYEEVVVKENGVEKVCRKEIEPLAADVRANSRSKMCKLIKSELLRVIAPMFGLEYDDLRQRHRERRNRRILAVTASAAVLGLTIGAAGVLTAIEINEQNEQISEQNEQIKAQNQEIKNNQNMLLANQAENLAKNALEELANDNRYGAVDLALQSLTEYNGIELVYTPEGRYALTESLGVYDATSVVKAKKQFETVSKIENVYVNSTGEYIMALDIMNNLYVWDVKNINALYEYKSAGIGTATFVGADKVAYCNSNGQVEVYDLANKKLATTIESEDTENITSDSEGKYIAVAQSDNMYVYDAETFSEIYSADGTEFEDDFTGGIIAENWFVYVNVDEIQVDGQDRGMSNMYFVDLSNPDRSFNIERESTGISDMKYYDEKLYILSDLGEADDYTSEAICVDVLGQSIIGENKVGKVANTIRIADIAGDKKVVVSSYSEMKIYDIDMGLEEQEIVINNGIADYTEFSDGKCYLLDRTGKFIYVDGEMGDTATLDFAFQCNIEDIDYFLGTTEGYLVSSLKDNRIIIYNVIENSDAKAVEGNEIEFSEIDQEEAAQKAKEIGSVNYKMAKVFLYSKDNSVAFVTYDNGIMEVYNVKDKKLVNTIDNVEGDVAYYAGEDKEGNMYVASYECGYCFDKDYQLITKISNLTSVDKDKNTLVAGTEENSFEYPIYSTDDLIEKAKSLLEK